jgi:REP element-mobilizing transposase RayT
MQLSEYGEIVENEILKMPEYNNRTRLDEWTIMPNHIHLLIELTNEKTDNTVDVDWNDNVDDGNGNVEKIHEFSLPTSQPTSQPTPQPTNKNPWWHNHDYKPTIDEIKQYRKQRRKMIIPKIIGKLQMQTSKQINILRNTPGQKNWQPNYHDHIVRDDASYQRIKNYIKNNPRNWKDDTFNVKKDHYLSPKNNGGAA